MMDVLVENSKCRSVHQTRVRHACGLVVSGVRSLTVTARNQGTGWHADRRFQVLSRAIAPTTGFTARI